MTIELPGRVLCTQALVDLLQRCDGVTAAMFASRDGRPYAEKSRRVVESGKLAAMASSLVALGHSVLKELGVGVLDHVLVDGSEGRLVITNVPGSRGVLILAVLASSDARLGLVLSHAKTCAQSFVGSVSPDLSR